MEHVTKRIWASALSLLLLIAPAGVWALGLGNIEVSSTLNEPLRARISLSALQSGDLDSMQVELASADQFKRAGIQRPFQLSKLRFRTVEDGADGGYIDVTTREAVVEPFLNFLVEVTWPRGRIIREYTILLDPPVYGAAISTQAKRDLAEIQARALQEPPAPEPVPAPAPARAAPEPATSQAMAPPPVRPAASTAAAPAPAPEPVPAAEPSMAAAPAPEPLPAAEPAMETTPAPVTMQAVGDLPNPYDVKYGDTLWSLAKRYRPDDSVSIQRMMLAMLSANPGAFNIPNINALRAGTVLRIPDVSQFGGADRQVVLAEVGRQNEAWQEYRQGLAAAAPQAPEGTSMAAAEPSSAAEAEVSAAEPRAQQAEQPTQAAAGGDDARLALVSGGQGTEGVGSASAEADASQVQQELVLAREEADAKARQAEELSSRVTELEGIVADLQRAIQLRDDNIAALQEMLAKLEQESDELRAAADQARAEAEAAGAVVEPAAEAAPEPVAQPTPQPTPEPAPEPVVEAAPEPVAQPAPEPVVEAAPSVEAAPEATPETVAAAQPEPVPAKPKKKKKRKVAPPPPQPQPTFLESILESLPVDPVLLGAGVGGLLVLLGGAALWRRRKSAEDVEDMGELDLGDLDETDLLYDENGEPYLPEDAGDETAISELEGMDLSDERAEPQVQAAQEDPLEATHIAAPGAAESVMAAADEEEEDPLTEVNVYLAYERYDQAEELVRSAIAQYPDRHEYKLRLLEVFYAGKDLGSFESSARELQDAVGADSPLMAEANKMWQDMSPGRELFSEGAGTVPEEQDVVFDVTGGDADEGDTIPTSGAAAGGESSSVDFDLGFESEGTLTEAASGESSLDFDLGFDQAGGGEAKDESGLDLDLTSIGGDSERAAGNAGGGSSVDFDLGEGAVAEAGGDSMDFDLSGIDESGGPSTETPLPQRASEGGSGLDFDLEGLGQGTLIDGQAPSEAAAESPDTADADFGDLDFDLEGIGGGSEGVESGALSADSEFTALDLNLDAAEEAGADSSAQRSGMDLDMGDELTALDDETSSALGFDIGGESLDAAAEAKQDDELDFGLDLGDGEDVAGGAELSLEADDAEVTDETVKLDLGAQLPGDDDFEQSLDTVKLDSAELDAADSAISDLGMDLNLDTDSELGSESPSGVDTAFEGIFGDESTAAASDDDLALSMDGSDLILPTPPPPDDEPAEEFPEIDLDFDAEKSQDVAAADEYESTQFMLRDIPPHDDSAPEQAADDSHSGRTLVLGGGLTGEVDEVQTKLDLAQAYIDMGDTDGAKGIIDEVLAEGNSSQKQAAMGLLGKLAGA